MTTNETKETKKRGEYGRIKVSELRGRTEDSPQKKKPQTGWAFSGVILPSNGQMLQWQSQEVTGIEIPLLLLWSWMNKQASAQKGSRWVITSRSYQGISKTKSRLVIRCDSLLSLYKGQMSDFWGIYFCTSVILDLVCGDKPSFMDLVFRTSSCTNIIRVCVLVCLEVSHHFEEHLSDVFINASSFSLDCGSDTH